MVRVSPLGRLGGSLLDSTLSLDTNLGSGSSEMSSDGSSFTPSSKVLDSLSLSDGSEKTVISNQAHTADGSADAAVLEAINKSIGVAAQVVSPGQVVAPPPAQGMSGEMKALIGFGALAVLGVAYAAFSE